MKIDTIFDRAGDVEECDSRPQEIYCNSCSLGPCVLALDEDHIRDDETRKGLCGAGPETFAVRDFARMVANGAASNADHARSVAEIFLAAAKMETDDYFIKDTRKLFEIAPGFGVDVSAKGKDGKFSDQDIHKIAVKVGENALDQCCRGSGSAVCMETRAPEDRYHLWKDHGVIPADIDRDIVGLLHQATSGAGLDWKNLVMQMSATALANGWVLSMIATDLKDVLFGCPYPVKSSVDLGVLKKDHVNIVINGNMPVLSEMIVKASELPEMADLAKKHGAKGIRLCGMCCSGSELLMRHGISMAGDFLQQERAIITGAVDAMVMDQHCGMENITRVAQRFHTRVIMIHENYIAGLDGLIHIEFQGHKAFEDAKVIVQMAIDNFPNRKSGVRIPDTCSDLITGFSCDAIKYHLGGSFRQSYAPLIDNMMNGRIRGVGCVFGCNSTRTSMNEGHTAVVKELLKNDVIVLSTGCSAIACANAGLLTPEAAQVFCGDGLAEVCETVGIPPVLHMGACADNSRILALFSEIVKAGGLHDISDMPVAGATPEGMSDEVISMGHCFVVSGIYMVCGATLAISRVPVFKNYLHKGMEELFAGMWDFEKDPVKLAHMMIAHIDKKRKALGIDKARERVLISMDDRRELNTA